MLIPGVSSSTVEVSHIPTEAVAGSGIFSTWGVESPVISSFFISLTKFELLLNWNFLSFQRLSFLCAVWWWSPSGALGWHSTVPVSHSPTPGKQMMPNRWESKWDSPWSLSKNLGSFLSDPLILHAEHQFCRHVVPTEPNASHSSVGGDITPNIVESVHYTGGWLDNISWSVLVNEVLLKRYKTVHSFLYSH